MTTVKYMILLLTVLLQSCGDSKIADDISKMQSRPIDLTSCDGAVCYERGREVIYDEDSSGDRLIIYIDSQSCSQCFISHMYDYDETVNELSSSGIETLFLFEPNHEQEAGVTEILEHQAYPFRIVVVKNGGFSKANPHLPSSSIFHSFLINKDNEVVIVGNPVRNDKIKKLMLNSVKR